MKTLFRIFGIIALFVSLLTCGMSIYRSNRDKNELEIALSDANVKLSQYKKDANSSSGETKAYLDQQIAAAEKELNSGTAASTYIVIEIFISALLALAMVFTWLLFRPNEKLTTQLLGMAIALLIAAYFISPDMARGEYGGFASRTLALISGIPVIIAGLCAYGIAKKSAVAQRRYA